MAFGGSVIGDVAVRVLADTTQFQKGVEKGVTGSLKKVGRLAGGLFAGFGAVSLFKDTIAEAQEATKVLAQTQAVIRSTGGVAGVSAADIGNLADSLSLVTGQDDELIAQGENVLATFTNIRNSAGEGNDIFTQTTKATLDLSAALGQDLQSSVIQVGKALNDPIKGVTALRRVGVSFTADQLKQIKALQTSGDLLSAQKIILGELNREFGGTAAAVATPLDKLKVSMKNVEETLGTGLMPALNAFAGILIKLSPILPTLIPVILAVVAGIKLWGFAQAALNIIMAANPITLVILAIGALILIVVLLVKKFHIVQDVLGALWDVFKTVFNWIKNNWPLLLAILIGPFGLAVKFIIDHWNGIVDFFAGVPGKIARLAVGMWDGIKDAFKAAVNFIIRAWNAIEFTIPGFSLGPIHFGGFTLGLPDIPELAQGGIVTSPTLALLGERGPEAVIPLRSTPDMARAGITSLAGMGSVNQTFITQARDERVLANEIAFRFEEMSRR